MRQETELFFQEVVSKNLSILDFIDSDWTFLNNRLARHYGIKGVTSSDLVRVKLKRKDHRGGVLTHGSILQLTSDAVRTKPITRAAFILGPRFSERLHRRHQSLLGTSFGHPRCAQRSLRERFELHRKNPACALPAIKNSTPLGFVLENYDGIGKWRETEP